MCPPPPPPPPAAPAEAERAAFFALSPLPAAIVGFDGVVEDANGAWEASTGWARGELVGRPLRDVLREGDLAPLGDPAALRRGALAGAWEGRCRRRDGSLAPFAWEVAADAQAQRYFCVARPLAADEARRQERFQADVLNLVAHELNTPLTPLQLALDALALRLDPETGRELRPSLDILERGLLRLRGLVAEVLDAARARAGLLKLELAETDLSALALEVADGQRGLAADAGVEVRANVEPGLRARADAARLRQALDAILACATACAPAGGSVELSAARVGGVVQVVGASPSARLRPEECDALFLPFPPEREGTGPRPPTGLGLFLARGIVELHGGEATARAGTAGGLSLAILLPPEGPAGHRAQPRAAQAARGARLAVPLPPEPRNRAGTADGGI